MLKKITALPYFEKDSTIFVGIINHPLVGAQLLSGTVEDGESPKQASERELNEEFGNLIVEKNIFAKRDVVETPVVHRTISCDYYCIPRGHYVNILSEQGNLVLIRYSELNKFSVNGFNFQLDLWVDESMICKSLMRYYYFIKVKPPQKLSWDRYADNTLFNICFIELSDAIQKIELDKYSSFFSKFRL